MVLYQLVAKGCYECFNGQGRISSKRVFAEKSEAEEHISQFREIVTKSRSEMDLWSLLDDDSLGIKIVELELSGVTHLSSKVPTLGAKTVDAEVDRIARLHASQGGYCYGSRCGCIIK